MRLVLYQPDIPQNTGTILRLAACLGVGVDVIGPAGFDLSDRALRRAGLDYIAHADLVRHDGWRRFDDVRRSQRAPGRLVLVTTKAADSYTSLAFRSSDYLLLGRESAGVPDAIHQMADERVVIPMVAGMRSLNVAVAAAMVVGEALRQTDGLPRMVHAL